MVGRGKEVLIQDYDGLMNSAEIRAAILYTAYTQYTSTRYDARRDAPSRVEKEDTLAC